MKEIEYVDRHGYYPIGFSYEVHYKNGEVAKYVDFRNYPFDAWAKELKAFVENAKHVETHFDNRCKAYYRYY